MSQEEVIPKQILQNILCHRVNILGNPQFGKSNTAKVLMSEFVRQRLLVQIKCYDTACNWRHNFLLSFKFQEINDDTHAVYNGRENILYDMQFSDPDKVMRFIGNDILLDYERNRARKNATVDGKLGDWIVYCIEEAHGSFGRFTLSRYGNNGNTWLKLIGEGGNFNQCFVFLGQRLADISASAVERSTCYLVGRTTGDNDVAKLQRILGKDAKDKQGIPLSELVKTLDLGQFLYWDGESCFVWNCPRFEDLYPNEKPMLVTPPKSRWLKLF